MGLAWPRFHPLARAEQDVLTDNYLDYLGEKWHFSQSKPSLLLSDEGGMDTKQKQPVATQETLITPKSLPTRLGQGERMWN